MIRRVMKLITSHLGSQKCVSEEAKQIKKRKGETGNPLMFFDWMVAISGFVHADDRRTIRRKMSDELGATGAV